MKNKPYANLKVYSLLALLGLSAIIPSIAMSSELLALLDVLKENGAITAAQYDRLRRQTEAAAPLPGGDCRPESPAAKPADHSRATIAAAARLDDRDQKPRSEPAAPKDKDKDKDKDSGAIVKTKGGLSIESADEAFAFELGGNLWVDGAAYSEDTSSLGNGVDLRRARLKLEGRLFTDWGYQAEYGFAGNEAEVKDAYVAYEGFDDLAIKLGQFKEPVSLEEQTSGSNITFMERALPVEAFSPGRKLGLGVTSGGKDWSAAGGVFGEAIGDDTDDEGDSGWALAARVTHAPIDSKGRLVHLGASAQYQNTDAQNEVRYRTRPESNVTDQRLVDTRSIQEASEILTWGLEGAGAVGPVSIQGEYLKVGVDRRDAQPKLDFDGWYLFAAWLITGEERIYDASQGRFEGVDPEGPYGALELALRYSTIDLDDADILGGQQQDVTLGLNWYLKRNLRFMTNYIWVDADPDRNGERDRPNVFQFRVQLDF
ncbi:OprO/OprP family phosphate-selective porin [Thiorhodovibrio frisius]|uniref:Phosphate-selective porin n=1 Tax=Thiorhodovibrio frisius TaxID=631362 RepID=H8Z4L1_9GAMM|nr:porin [Thiorhodovibrio frisius]EIC20268.1 phosphate-selective porin [Thiorhodovibrio frisius]WPL21005.1 Outer membrane protein D1 [Thiorhodovibrio frisius]